MKVYGESVEIDASLDPQCPGSQAITRVSATKLKKVVRWKELVYLVHLSQMGVKERMARNNQFQNAWECMLKEFADLFPSNIQAYLRNALSQ
jgi:hypothetical protein